MTLKGIRDWLKPKISELSAAYIGKIDPAKEKVICIYTRANTNNRIAIGGLENTTTARKTISILVQWSKNCDTSEVKAKSIYDIFNGQRAVIDNVDAFFIMKNSEPVGVGTNDNDIFEYVIDLDVIYMR